MGLSLKREEMIEFLEAAKTQAENFGCMLWGTVYADISSFQNRSDVSNIISWFGAPGVSGSLDGAFCYIGLTEQSLYVIALDAYNTSKIIGTFVIPFHNITSVKLSKGLGSFTVVIDSGSSVSLTVKNTSIGTNIKDQKERVAGFLEAIEILKSRFI